MEIDKLHIANDLWFEHQEHCNPSIVYINRSTDHWHSDDEIDIDLNEDEARKIILWLREKFNLTI